MTAAESIQGWIARTTLKIEFSAATINGVRTPFAFFKLLPFCLKSMRAYGTKKHIVVIGMTLLSLLSTLLIMKTRLAAMAALAMSIAATPPANSDMVSYVDALPSFGVPGSVEVQLPLFDPSLGTLTRVSLAINGNGEVDYDVLEDFGDDGGAVTATMFGEFTARVGSGQISSTWNLSGDDSYVSTGFFSAPVSGSTGDFSTDPATVGLFVATVPSQMFDTEILLDGADASTSDLNDDFIALGGNINAGQITVVYEFTPVPEPNSIAVLGLISFALSLFRHRRN